MLCISHPEANRKGACIWWEYLSEYNASAIQMVMVSILRSRLYLPWEFKGGKNNMSYLIGEYRLAKVQWYHIVTGISLGDHRSTRSVYIEQWCVSVCLCIHVWESKFQAEVILRLSREQGQHTLERRDCSEWQREVGATGSSILPSTQKTWASWPCLPRFRDGSSTSKSHCSLSLVTVMSICLSHMFFHFALWPCIGLYWAMLKRCSETLCKLKG